MTSENNCTQINRTDYNLTTSIVSSEASLTWRLENFSMYPHIENESICSPLFQTADTTWKLELYPKGQKTNPNKIGVYLHKISSGTQEHQVYFKICLKDKNGEDCHTVEKVSVFKGNESKNGKSDIIDRNMLLDKLRDGLLPNDTLTVYCELSAGCVCTSNITKRTLKETENIDSASSSSIALLDILSHDLATLFGEQKNCDVILKASDKEFPAHKAVLTARSPVFAAMFKHDTQERQDGVVEIPDIEAPNLNDLLWYIYSGRINNMTSFKAIGLYVASGKYCLGKLKEECQRFIADNLSEEIFGNAAVLAHTHSDEILKKSLKDYFCRNASELLSVNQWKLLLNERPDIATEYLQTIANRCMGNDQNL